MAHKLEEIRPLVGAAALYAAAGIAQRGLGFLLLPLYTRLIDPAEYGVLELLNAVAAVVFGVLTLGLVSAINKCYHRDCPSPADRQSLLSTAFLVDLPFIALGAVVLVAAAGPLSRWLVGQEGAEGMMALVGLTGALSSAGTLVLASLRAQERALAFGILTLIQFLAAAMLNVLFVATFRMGVQGILWGNLLAQAISIPAMVAAVRWSDSFKLNRRLVRPLLSFGLPLVPIILSSWIMNASDRYVLSLYRPLDEVAVYGVGYKIGMIVEMAIVWPFQLAWPAFSFGISNRPDHRETYAQTLTYLTAILALLVLLLTLSAPSVLGVLVGSAYRHAHLVVLPVALAYAFNGVQYCLAPGVHLAGKTHYLPFLSAAAALVNLGLNFTLIPRYGMVGAAWSTTLAFITLALAMGVLAQRSYPVPYEYGRLAKILAAATLAYLVHALAGAPDTRATALVSALGITLVGFPCALTLLGFANDAERTTVRSVVQRGRAALLVGFRES